MKDPDLCKMNPDPCNNEPDPHTLNRTENHTWFSALSQWFAIKKLHYNIPPSRKSKKLKTSKSYLRFMVF